MRRLRAPERSPAPTASARAPAGAASRANSAGTSSVAEQLHRRRQQHRPDDGGVDQGGRGQADAHLLHVQDRHEREDRVSRREVWLTRRRPDASRPRAAWPSRTAENSRQSPESVRALLARVFREAASTAGSDPQVRPPRAKTAGGAAVFRRREEWFGSMAAPLRAKLSVN